MFFLLNSHLGYVDSIPLCLSVISPAFPNIPIWVIGWVYTYRVCSTVCRSSPHCSQANSHIWRRKVTLQSGSVLAAATGERRTAQKSTARICAWRHVEPQTSVTGSNNEKAPGLDNMWTRTPRFLWDILNSEVKQSASIQAGLRGHGARKRSAYPLLQRRQRLFCLKNESHCWHREG